MTNRTGLIVSYMANYQSALYCRIRSFRFSFLPKNKPIFCPKFRGKLAVVIGLP